MKKDDNFTLIKIITQAFLAIIILFLLFKNFSINYLSPTNFLRFNILLGFICGYLRFTKNQDRLFVINVLIASLLPLLAVLMFSLIKHSSISILPLIVWPGISLLALLGGLLLRNLKINNLLKAAFVRGMLLILIFASCRNLGEGWFAVITIFSFNVAAINLAILHAEKNVINFSIMVAPTLILSLIFGDISGIIIITPVLLIAILTSYLIFHFAVRNKMNLALVFAGIVIWAALSPLLWLMQENYVANYYGTKNHLPKITPLIKIHNIDDEIIIENKNNTSVYLFWSASCSRCKKEFPYFSELALKYKDRKDIKFFAVFLEFKKSDSIVYNREIRQDYNFEWAIAPKGRELYDSLIVNGVPHLTIINHSHNKILYNGYVANRPWLYINHPDRFLQ